MYLNFIVMEHLNKVIVATGKALFCRLKYYLTPYGNTKRDLLVLSYIDSLLEDDLIYEILSERDKVMLERVSQKIINSNKYIKHYRI